MKSGSGGAVLGGLLLGALIVVTGEDIERFLTDVQREQQHPTLANFGRSVGAFARVVKDVIGLSEA